MSYEFPTADDSSTEARLRRNDLEDLHHHGVSVEAMMASPELPLPLRDIDSRALSKPARNEGMYHPIAEPITEETE